MVKNFSDNTDNIPNLAYFKTACIYGICVILNIKSDYLREQLLLNFVSSEHELRFL